MWSTSSLNVYLTTEKGCRKFRALVAVTPEEQELGMKVFAPPVPNDVAMFFLNTQGKAVSGVGMAEPLLIYALDWFHTPSRRTGLNPNQLIRLTVEERTLIETSTGAPILHMDEELIAFVRKLYREEKA